jgi:hypothetical protein
MNHDQDTPADNGAASAPRARPQLFGAGPAPRQAQADFGPSILATIDGGGPRFSKRRSRSRRSSKLWFVMLGLPLAAGAVFVAMRQPAPSGTGVPAVTPSAVAASVPKAVRLAAAAPASAAMAAASVPVNAGAATIETVVALPSVASSAVPLAPLPPVAASGAMASASAAVKPIPPAAETAAPAAVAAVAKSANDKPAVASKSTSKPVASQDNGKSSRKSAAIAKEPSKPADTRLATRGDKPSAAAASASAVAPTAAKPATRGTPDTDAELLAAMLPHLQRMSAEPAPRSPAYDKRCGQTKGKAAESCRVKFCNGRQGADPACPATTGAAR